MDVSSVLIAVAGFATNLLIFKMTSAGARRDRAEQYHHDKEMFEARALSERLNLLATRSLDEESRRYAAKLEAYAKLLKADEDYRLRIRSDISLDEIRAMNLDFSEWVIRISLLGNSQLAEAIGELSATAVAEAHCAFEDLTQEEKDRRKSNHAAAHARVTELMVTDLRASFALATQPTPPALSPAPGRAEPEV